MEKTIHFSRYFQAGANLTMRLTVPRWRFSGPFDKASLTLWQEKARKALRKDLGIAAIEKSAIRPRLDASVMERKEIGSGIIREKVILSIEDDYDIPMYILIPENPKSSFLTLAGHHSTGKAGTAGAADCQCTLDMIEKHGYDYGLQLARRGHAAICPDPIGQGERREGPVAGDEYDRYHSASCLYLSRKAIALGFSLPGLMAYENMRILDYILTREDLPHDINAIGFSGGGMQVLYLSALDLRVQHTIISGYFYGVRDSLMIAGSNCSCNFAPSLFSDFDMGDTAGLIAPRRLTIQSGVYDNLNGQGGIENVIEQVKLANRAYAVFGERIEHDIRMTGHYFSAEVLDSI